MKQELVEMQCLVMLQFIVNKRREGDKRAKPKGFWVTRVELTC